MGGGPTRIVMTSCGRYCLFMSVTYGLSVISFACRKADRPALGPVVLPGPWPRLHSKPGEALQLCFRRLVAVQKSFRVFKRPK